MDSSKNRRFFVVTNAVAVAIATLAAAVNVFVGPFNVCMWLVPVAMVCFSAVTLVLVDATVRQAEDPDVVPWMARRLFGSRVTHCSRWAYRTNARGVSRLFLTAAPCLFLVFAALLLFASITGQVNSPG